MASPYCSYTLPPIENFNATNVLSHWSFDNIFENYQNNNFVAEIAVLLLLRLIKRLIKRQKLYPPSNPFFFSFGFLAAGDFSLSGGAETDSSLLPNAVLDLLFVSLVDWTVLFYRSNFLGVN